MKRMILFSALVLTTIGISAQFKKNMTVEYSTDIMDVGTLYTFNLTDMIESMEIDKESFLSNWERESWKMVYVIDGEKILIHDKPGRFNLSKDGHEGTDWNCEVLIDKRMNQIQFLVFQGRIPNPNDEASPLLPLNVGDVCHAVFCIEYEGKTATFEIEMCISNHTNSSVMLDNYEKVGEESLFIKYLHNSSNSVKFDARSIARLLGRNATEFDLIFASYSNKEKTSITDSGNNFYMCSSGGGTYTLGYDFTCSYSSADPKIRIQYDSWNKTISLSPEGKYEDGTEVSGPVFLVYNNRYYELKITAQLGDADEDTRNIATVENAQKCGIFSGSITVRPSFEGLDRYYISFSLSAIAKVLDIETQDLKIVLNRWLKGERVTEEGTELIYNLTDNASTRYNYPGVRGSFYLSKDGFRGGDWSYALNLDEELNELQFEVHQMADVLRDEDVCHARIGLYYNGRLVEFDIMMNVSDGLEGSFIEMTNLTKVGEEIISGYYDYKTGLIIPIDLEAIGLKFGDHVEGKSLKMYVMQDPDNETLISCVSDPNSLWFMLDLECVDHRSEYYNSVHVLYDVYDSQLCFKTYSSPFQIGKRMSGSLFLVDNTENKYYEIVLDISFVPDEKSLSSVDVVDIQKLDVKLMTTDSYYTCYDAATRTYALVTTPVDIDAVAEKLGTNTPVLYAEQLQDGKVIYTCEYTAAPAQGFWFASKEDGTAYVSDFQNDCCCGFYFIDGELRWYEIPRRPQAGDSYNLYFFLVNPLNGRAVKYEVYVKYYNKLQGTISSHNVRRLPVGMNIDDATIMSLVSQDLPLLSERGVIFNLQGQRLSVPQRGINIFDGHKVFIK